MKFLLFLTLFIFIRIVEAQTLLPGFTRIQVGGTLNTPTVLAFVPDGRIFVAQQSGSLRVIKAGTLLTTPFVSLSVNSSGERGLIGVTLDPDFISNNYIYVYYTVPSAGVGIAPFNRISRFTANGDVALAGSEQIILNLDPLSSATNHNGGAIAFGTDGKLYVAVGDNANSSTPQNLDTYHGKFLRINKDGSAPSDNPFFSPTASEQRKRIWAFGLRNPYTFSIQPGTGKIFVNDVGQNAVEEINDATVGGKNFGWPTAEGASTNPNFTNPIFLYNHTGAAPTGCAITGGTFFNPQFTTYPAAYIGKYFFQDFCTNWIYSLDLSGTPTATLFASSVGGSSVSLMTGPDGNLYYLSRGSQALYKITSTSSSAPAIIQQPSSISVSVDESAELTVSATGTGPLQYQWQKNEVDISGANQSSLIINNAQLTDAGNFRVRVTNIAGQNFSNTATLTVIENAKPVSKILTPTAGTLYSAGTSISFSGSGTDAEDGVLSASAMSWQINFHHDDHKHDEPARQGISSGMFNIPDEGETSANVWYRIILTVMDSKGSAGKDSIDVYPRKSFLNFITNPPGLQITIDGQPRLAPIAIESVEGLKREIGTPAIQQLDGVGYEFSNWLHGGDIIQLITTPADNITYTASFSAILGLEGNRTTVYPNPVADWLTISHRNVSSIRLTDMIGKSWNLTSEHLTESTRVDVRNLPSGIYLLSFSSDQILFRYKLLIER